MWASPLKQPKPEKTEPVIEKFKKAPPVISRASVKRIADVLNVDTIGCEWADRWVEQLIRENCYPPQLLHSDFESMLGKFLEIKDAIAILARFKEDYRRAFPLAICAPPPDDLSWLADTLRADPAVIEFLPPHYLD